MKFIDVFKKYLFTETKIKILSCNSSKTLAVAQWIVNNGRVDGQATITPMKLIKLVYIAHGHMLGEYGLPLLDEKVQAWQYGPVNKSVYQAVRQFRSFPVDYVRGANNWTGEFSALEIEIMEKVAKAYGSYDAITLSAATHKPGTPWSLTMSFGGKNPEISNDIIEHFYKNNLRQESYSSL